MINLGECLLNRVYRVLNVLGKRNVGIFAGLGMGIAACLMMPMTVSLFSFKTLQWLLRTLDGKIELPLTLLAMTLLMVLIALMLSGLRAYIAYFFRGRRYRTR